MASDMTEGMLLDLLPQLKTLVSTPSTVSQARAIIDSHPQLTYSLMKTMVALGLVDPNVVSKKIAASQPAVPPVPDFSQQPPISAQPVVPQPQPSYHDPPTSLPPASSSRPIPPQAPSTQAPSVVDDSSSTSRTASRFGPPISATNTVGTPPVNPPVATNTVQPPPTQSQTAVVAAAINALPPDQRNTIVQILSLTPEQINAMPAEGRARINEVRRSILGPGA